MKCHITSNSLGDAIYQYDSILYNRINPCSNTTMAGTAYEQTYTLNNYLANNGTANTLQLFFPGFNLVNQ